MLQTVSKVFWTRYYKIHSFWEGSTSSKCKCDLWEELVHSHGILIDGTTNDDDGDDYIDERISVWCELPDSCRCAQHSHTRCENSHFTVHQYEDWCLIQILGQYQMHQCLVSPSKNFYHTSTTSSKCLLDFNLVAFLRNWGSYVTLSPHIAHFVNTF